MTPSEKEQRDRVVREAFECRHALEAYAYAALGDFALAEDVVQAAFLVVMDKFAEFRAGTSMLAWCRAMVRLKVFEALRERKRLETTEDGLLDDAIAFAFEDAQEVEQAAVRSERMARLRESSQQPRVTYEQVGRAAGMTVEAVRKGLYRVRQSLRACVAGSAEAMP